jgi:3-methyladenine DNA glycosylase AlkD
LQGCQKPESGINLKNTYGISIPALRKIAKEAGKNHCLALKLMNSEIHKVKTYINGK